MMSKILRIVVTILLLPVLWIMGDEVPPETSNPPNFVHFELEMFRRGKDL